MCACYPIDTVLFALTLITHSCTHIYVAKDFCWFQAKGNVNSGKCYFFANDRNVYPFAHFLVRHSLFFMFKYERNYALKLKQITDKHAQDIKKKHVTKN